MVRYILLDTDQQSCCTCCRANLWMHSRNKEEQCRALTGLWSTKQHFASSAHYTAPHYITPHDAALHFINAMPYYTMLYCIAQHSTAPHHNTMLYCIVQHHTILYCIVQHHTMLYCIVQHHSVLCCVVQHQITPHHHTLCSNTKPRSEDSLCSTSAQELDLGPDRLLELALHQHQLLVAAGLLLQLLRKAPLLLL